MRKTTLPLFLVFSFAFLATLGFLLLSHNTTTRQEKVTTAPISERIAQAKKKAVLGTISVSLKATADTSIDAHTPTTNYGASSSDAAGHYSGSSPVQQMRVLMKFDLGLIPVGSTVNSATLSLYEFWGSGTPFGNNTLYVAPTSNSWAELTTTWNTRPGYYYGSAQSSTVNTTVGWKDFNVKNIVAEWVAGTKANYGFIIYGSEYGDTWYRYFYSLDEAGTTYDPHMVINYTLPDTTAPTISTIVISEITKTTAKIAWTTDEPSSSIVDYGPTSSYGASLGAINLVTSHSVPLANLSAGQIYHFRVRSKDASNNEAASGDYTFTTTTEVSPGTGTNTAPATGTNTSNATTELTPATNSAAFTAAKKSAAATTSAKKTNQNESKIAGIKTPIFVAVVALLIILAIGALVFFLKFRHGHPAKTPPPQVQNPPTPNEPNKTTEAVKVPEHETQESPDKNIPL